VSENFAKCIPGNIMEGSKALLFFEMHLLHWGLNKKTPKDSVTFGSLAI
jgi:hypothetical protein